MAAIEPKLPNVHCAVVEERKITDYLLNALHYRGSSKAKFFSAFGFAQREWRAFKDALLAQATSNPVVKVTQTEFGAKYEVKCHCPTPDGRNPCIHTVWQIEPGNECPRLLTAYPAK